jgi:hypothetical protein
MAENTKHHKHNSMISKNYTLITGAGKGLGRALARECASRCRNLILISLPEENLCDFCNELENAYDIVAHYFEMDLTDINAVDRLVETVLNDFSIDMLINNAGVGGSKPFDEVTSAYIDNIIMLNVRALSLLTHAMIPELKRHERAYILNIGSIAAYSPFPYKTVYPASKAFVNSFSLGLKAELMNTSVKVCVVNPGPVLTNGDVIDRINRYGYLGRISALTPEKAANICINAVFKGKGRIFPGIMTKLNFLAFRFIPYAVRLHFMRRMVCNEMKVTFPREQVLEQKTPVKTAI